MRLLRFQLKAMKLPALLVATFLAWALYATTAESQGDSSCWTIRLGAFSEITNATNRLDSLDTAQCRVFSDSGRHRVLCGCFASLALARQSIAQWQDSEPGAFVVNASVYDSIGNTGKPAPVSGPPAIAIAQLDLPQAGFDPQPAPAPVDVASDTFNPRGIHYFDRDPAAEQSEFSNLTGVEKANVLRRRPYERIPETELSVELFGRMLTIGGELSLKTEARRNFALATEPDDPDRNTLELQLEFFLPLLELQRRIYRARGGFIESI